MSTLAVVLELPQLSESGALDARLETYAIDFFQVLDSWAMRHIPLRLWALSILSAILQWLPFPLAGPVPAWRRLTCWFCLVPLLLALNGYDRAGKPLSFRAAALVGYACGIVWFLGNCYWIYQTMFHYGGLPPVAAAGILLLFSLYLGLYFGMFGALFALLRRQAGDRWVLALVPLLWVTVELARTQITGFPWDLLGYTQVDNSLLIPLAPWTGVMGLSLVVSAGNALWLWRPTGKMPALRIAGPLLACCVIAWSVAGSSRVLPPAHAEATAILLQDNLSVGAESAGPRESEREMLQSFSALTAHPRMAPELARWGAGLSPHPDLVAWPEAPTSFADADPALRAALAAVTRAAGAPLVVDDIGVGPVPNPSGRYDEFASASFYLPDGTYAGRYDKMHLVPFGEYTPYKQLFFFAGHLLDGLNFVPGTERRAFSVNGHRFGVFICYESIFGNEIREFARDGAQVLVNLSDDGWYGDTSAPWEHLDMARMRAIENRRWLLRDTNTGVTGSIDPQGRIVSALPRHVRDALEVPFGYSSDLTFYTRYGDWIGWLCGLAIAAFLAGRPLQEYLGKLGRQER